MATDNTKTAKDMGLVVMMTAKYAGTCACCKTNIRAGKDTIGYSRETKLVFCRDCAARYDSRKPAEEQAAAKVAAIIAAKKAAPAKTQTRTVAGFRPVPGCGRCRALGTMCPDCRHDEYDL